MNNLQDIETMKTAEDIIKEIEHLPPEEYNKVEAYFHVTENGFTPEGGV